MLDEARWLLRARRFPDVLSLLENRVFEYRDSFDFYFILGTACMYLGDSGGANSWFQGAKKIRPKDINLLNAEAALFLRRGDTDRSVENYLYILTLDPENKLAQNGLKFIQEYGDAEMIAQWVVSGKIKRFYPPLGVHPLVFKVAAWVGIALCTGLLLFFVGRSAFVWWNSKPRGPLPELALSAEEKKASVETDMSASAYRYILSSSEVTDAYDAARQYFGEGKDNASRIEINRILNSNAAQSVKTKALQIADYFTVPTFDTLKDNYAYSVVAEDPYLYNQCWVIWSGRITNMQKASDIFRCDLLVGYESMQRVDGIVTVEFSSMPIINAVEPVQILGQIMVKDEKFILAGKAVYQPLNGAN